MSLGRLIEIGPVVAAAIACGGGICSIVAVLAYSLPWGIAGGALFGTAYVLVIGLLIEASR